MFSCRWIAVLIVLVMVLPLVGCGEAPEAKLPPPDPESAVDKLDQDAAAAAIQTQGGDVDSLGSDEEVDEEWGEEEEKSE